MDYLLNNNSQIKNYQLMKDTPILPFKNHMLLMPLLFVLAIWLVFWVEVKWDVSFNKWGVLPRDIQGLRGVLFSPFIHGDITHLWHNTLPLLILSTALFYFYDNVANKVLLLGFFLTGIATWSIGRTAHHIGASGIIYMLFGFLLFKGLMSKNLRLLALSFFVVFVYGGMIWYVVPIDIKISWEGHLSGLFIGFVLALINNKNSQIDEKPKYLWELPNYDDSNDPFMQCFDENGRFVPTPKPEPEIIDVVEENTVIFESDHGIRLIYHSIKTKKKHIY